MPIYAYSIVQGYKHTSNRKKYFTRIVLIALLSQLPFMCAFETKSLNVCFTWLFGLAVLWLFETKNITIYGKIPLVMILLGIICIIPMDYGSYGVLAVILTYLSEKFKTRKILFARTAILVVTYGILPLPMLFDLPLCFQPLAVLAIPIIYIAEITDKARIDNKIGKYLYRYFYPVHLTIIAAIHIATLLR